MQDDIKIYSPGTVVFGSATELNETDLKADKVHLLDSGMSKLAETMIADLKICLKDVEKLRSDMFDDDDIVLESSQLADKPTKTPKTLRKRQRVQDDSNLSPEHGGKKSKGKDNSESMLDRINVLIKSIEDERVRTFDKLKVFEVAQGLVVEKQKETDEQVEKLTNLVENDSILFATMKEDIDAGENELLKDTVVVKRMKTILEIPKDKKLLAKFVQTEGRKLVTDIMGNDDVVKYVATLYSNNNNTNTKGGKRGGKEKDGEPTIPPFKIIFKTREQGIKFRERAVAKAKEEDSDMGKIYFTHMQNNSTRSRTILMWGVVDYLKKEKKESWVNLNQNKPNIQVKEGGKITKTLTFAQAMYDYGEKIDPKTIEEASKAAKWSIGGQLERLFIILKD